MKPIYLKLCGTLSKYIYKNVNLDRYFSHHHYISSFDMSTNSFVQLSIKFDDELFDVTYKNFNNAIKKELLKTIHR
jgi:hypothetical protein